MRSRNYKAVKMILWWILIANFVVAIIKIGIGLAWKSQSVMADGIHSVSDGASNIVGLIGIWLASKPRDREHPYGHSKYEIVASLLIGIMLAVMSVRILTQAITSFSKPFDLTMDAGQVLLMVFTIVLNGVVAITEFRLGRKLNSTILVTDSLHTRGDLLISGAVLMGMLGIQAGLPGWVDGAMSILVAIAVLVSAWKIMKSCVDVLVDSNCIDSREVKNLLMSIPGIYDVHQIRSRGKVPDVFIDLHVIVDPQKSVLCAHDLSHGLEAILKEHFGANTEVTIHVEPNDGRHGS